VESLASAGSEMTISKALDRIAKRSDWRAILKRLDNDVELPTDVIPLPGKAVRDWLEDAKVVCVP